MERRRFLGGCLAVVPLAGCTGSGSDDSTETDDPTGTDDSTETNTKTESEAVASLGEWGQVTDRTATRPTEVRTADRVVFDARTDDDIVWEPAEGKQFLLVRVERKVTDAPDGELVAFPDPYGYRVQAGGSTYEPRPGPKETNAMAEPFSGAYAMGAGAKGAEGSSTNVWLGFEVSGDVAPGDVELRYVEADGDPLVWQPSADG